MLVHCVYIWLRDDLTDAERTLHVDRMRALSKIDGVRFFHFGAPANTDRPVIDRSYSYALVVGCDDEAALEAYRADPLHAATKDIAERFWKRQVVYDSIEPDVSVDSRR